MPETLEVRRKRLKEYQEPSLLPFVRMRCS